MFGATHRLNVVTEWVTMTIWERAEPVCRAIAERYPVGGPCICKREEEGLPDVDLGPVLRVEIIPVEIVL